MLKFKLLLLTLSLFCLINLSAQTLSAKVVDENNEALVGATVYFNGTTRGVITNLDGVFNISIPESLAQPVLIITYLGYETQIVNDIAKIEQVIQLSPNQESLESIDLYTSPFSRKEMERVFRRYLLGTGREARKSEILNMDDVILYYLVDKSTLYAEASEPVVIMNDYLGYKIKFNLENFEVRYNTKSIDHIDMKQSYYAGYSFFEDINPNREHHRIKTYLGSKEHFFKTLITGQISQSKFKVFFQDAYRDADKLFNVRPKSLKISEISLSNYVRSYQEGQKPLEIIVKYKREFTKMKFLKHAFQVDNFGNELDFRNIFLTGEFADYKLARTLPSNFTLKRMN